LESKRKVKLHCACTDVKLRNYFHNVTYLLIHVVVQYSYISFSHYLTVASTFTTRMFMGVELIIYIGQFNDLQDQMKLVWMCVV